jgi:hypothetical protein
VTRINCRIIHNIKIFLTNSSSNSSRLCAGSSKAPNTAIRAAPMLTKIVPMSEYRVKGSESIKVAQIELKTRPDA